MLTNFTYQVLNTTTSINFTSYKDSSLGYIVYVRPKVDTPSYAKIVLPGKDGEWMQAVGWFNETGDAFWDGRQTSIGPPITVVPYTNNNAVRADGALYEACIGVYKKVVTSTGGDMLFVEASETFYFKSPSLENNTTTTSTTTTITTDSTNTTTTTTTKRGGKKR